MLRHTDEKWDIHILKIAKLCSEMSKDPSTKVGAVIKAPNKTIISTGYNGFPSDVEDKEDWYKDREIKYKLIVHAEMNTLKHAKQIPEGSTLYIYPLLPCYECAKEIVKTGIKKVVTLSHQDVCSICDPEKECAKERWKESWKKSTEFMQKNGINIIYYNL